VRHFSPCGLLLLVVLAGSLLASESTPTLYVMSWGSESYLHDDQSHPCAGLFATNDGGQSWDHYGWYYGKFFSVSTDEIDGTRRFFLSCGNGVLTSLDGGEQWQISTGWETTECLKTAIDPSDPETIYLASAYGIFKTTDTGNTWSERNTGLTDTFTGDLFIDNSDPRVLFCATEKGIHRSRNGAESWEPVALLGRGIRTLCQHPSNPDLMAAGTEDHGVFISRDHGKTWTAHNTGLSTLTIYALTFDPNNPDILYAGTYIDGIFKTTDGGASWTPINKGLSNLDIHAVAVDPTNSDRLYAGTMGDGVWMSTDQGKKWSFIGLETSTIWDMIIEP
jgi:photosystem II stability/assembly factor-like uncharacterized protein